MKKNRLTYHTVPMLCLLGIGAMVTACTSDAENTGSDSGEPIRLYTSVTGRDATSTSESTGKGEELRARLLFWQADDYRDVILKDKTWPTPFLDIVPTEEIDYYQVANGIPFNTRHSYPPGNGQVHVIGYAPSELTSSDGYKTLNIPLDLQDGKNDFLSGDGNRYRVGSAIAPFEFSDKETNEGQREDLEQKQLEFCHLTAKILFEAKRAPSMARRVGVRNVEVILYNQQVPTTLEWQCIEDEDKELGGYFPTNPIEKKIELKNAYSDMIIINANQNQKVDSCYVYTTQGDTHYHGDKAGNTEGTITLSADIRAELIPYNTGTGDWDYDLAEQQEWKNVEVKINSKTGNELKMGYQYKVIITFDINGIRLQGVEMDWDQGGTHYVPITPVEETNKEEEKNDETTI